MSGIPPSILVPHWSEIEPALWPWKNFTRREVACPHCGELYYDWVSMSMLQRARDTLGRSMRINSGHRCIIHNAHVGGAPRSAHKLMIAFDISIRGQDPRAVLDACREAGFGSYGFYYTFLHTDRRPGRRWFGSDAGRKLWTSVLSAI